MNSKINVVFASDNNYAQHATVAMASILNHTATPARLAFYLLADNITSEIQDKVRTTVEHFGASLTVIAVAEQDLADMFVSGQLSRAAYVRLLMSSLLPPEVEKAIYLDCDLVVCDDICQLWDFDLNGHPLGAVPDYGIMASSRVWREKQQLLGCKAQDNYFNSGVLVVDVKQWREKAYGEKVLDLARGNSYPHHDQDALNKIFLANWQILPLRWNVIPPIWNMFMKILFRGRFRKPAMAARRDIAILHYAGGYKPWEYQELADFNAEYYRCLKSTAFRDVSMPQFDQRRKGRSITRQLWRLKIADFWQKILSQ